ncbi:polysaccharide pyruvyl transferase family protein [Frankia sp. Mgl5]|uniref:polysaccharide pyruvyl transferase family protein n=1 Tax=Frankia sp. Mgl5 TaxID=2933793 RepID=UPI0034D74676
MTGSVIALAGPGGIVWGSGILDDSDRIHPGAELAAVRGPLTREAAIRSGVSCPAVFGDPALLVSRFLRRRRDRIGRRPAVVPHFSDKARAQLGVPRGWDVVDVQAGVEEVVDRLVSAPLIASSSLHGLIISHAYGVPAAWVSFGGRDREGRRHGEGDGTRAGTLPSGDDSKFHDYFLSVGLPVPPPVPVGRTGTGLESGRVRDFATAPASLPDLDLLLDRCPFR